MKIEVPGVLSARILQALAHPIRISLLRAIAEGSHCQCELSSVLGKHPVDISRHLSVLIRAGLVELEKKGTRTYPRLLVPEVMDLLAAAEHAARVVVRRRADQAGRMG